jgi:HAD superfamily hydrolase (TIGR01450 family)
MDLCKLYNKKLFVLDMDGTFYRGGILIEGALEFVETLKNAGKDYIFFTNNSSSDSLKYVNKLGSMGLTVTSDKIITSGTVTADWINKFHAGKSVYLVGTSYLRNEFLTAGIKLVEDGADMVVVGFNTGTTYDQLTKACDLIRAGAMFVATHPDTTCPTETGFVPDCGAVTAFIIAATGGAVPEILGKPNRETLDYILNITGYSKEDLVFVGDRLYTDIAIGKLNGVLTALVLTGETAMSDIENSPYKPDIIVDRLFDLSI